jgi:hypothetical protein
MGGMFKGIVATRKVNCIGWPDFLDAIDEDAQQRTAEIEIPQEILAAAASGPGTTLGGPQ